MLDSKEIGKRLEMARIKSDMSLNDVAKIVGVNKSTVLRYENGEVADVKAPIIEKFAMALRVSPHFLLGWSDDDMQLPKNISLITTKKFPMLGEIACGEPIFAKEEHETYIEASSNIKADYCLRAVGDSMINARIFDGDVVFVKQMPIVQNGEIAAVIIDNDATLKRWYYYPEQKKLLLTPENPAYEPLVFLEDELDTIRCLGKAVCFMSNL